MATPDSTPIDPDDLARRLQNVLAEQHLQELQLSKRLQGQDIDIFKLGRKLNLRHWKSAPPNKESQSQQSHTPSKGEQHKSVRRVFRTRSAYSARQSDSECASNSGSTPKNDYKNVEHAASSRQSQGQREITQKHDPQEADRGTSVMELESVDENGGGRAGDPEKNYSTEWNRTDTSDSKPRGLQLLKRMGSISALKAKLGGETREYHDEKAAGRTQFGSIPEEGPAVQRKHNVFLKLRR